MLEDISGKLNGLAEVVTSMDERLSNVEKIIEPIPQILTELETIKAVQREQGKDLHRINDYLVDQGMPIRA